MKKQLRLLVRALSRRFTQFFGQVSILGIATELDWSWLWMVAGQVAVFLLNLSAKVIEERTNPQPDYPDWPDDGGRDWDYRPGDYRPHPPRPRDRKWWEVWRW